MKKLVLFLTFLSFSLYAQKAIEIKSTGEVFPRVSLTSTTDNITVGVPSLSQMVYNTNTALADGVGYYFWNGTNWTKLGAGAAGTLPSTAIVLSETASNIHLQGAGYLNSGKAMIPFQGWERTLNSTNEFLWRNYAENCLISETNSFWAFWGGGDGTGSPAYHNDGKYYRLANNDWINFPAAPGGFDGRRGHSMSYSGSNLIIWGGFNDSFLSTGMYIPFSSTGSGAAWTQMDNNGAPTPRYGHSTVLPFVWGGKTGPSTATNTGKRMDLSTNPIGWGAAIPTLDAPSARYDHVALARIRTIPSLQENMLVWGGKNGNDSPLSDGGIFNITTNTWSAITNVNSPVNTIGVSIAVKSTSSSTESYFIVVTGGTSPVGNNGNSTVGKYYNGSWNDITAEGAPKLKYHSSVVDLFEGKYYLFLWGGQIDDGGSTLNDKVYTFSLTDNVWLEPADAQPTVTPSSSRIPHMVWDKINQKVIVYSITNASLKGGIFNPLKLKPYYLFKKQ